MASIRKRNKKWQVQIRRKNFPLQTQTFQSKKLPISVISIFVMVVLISWGGPDDSGWGRE